MQSYTQKKPSKTSRHDRDSGNDRHSGDPGSLNGANGKNGDSQEDGGYSSRPRGTSDARWRTLGGGGATNGTSYSELVLIAKIDILIVTQCHEVAMFFLPGLLKNTLRLKKLVRNTLSLQRHINLRGPSLPQYTGSSPSQSRLRGHHRGKNTCQSRALGPIIGLTHPRLLRSGALSQLYPNPTTRRLSQINRYRYRPPKSTQFHVARAPVNP